MLTQALDHYSQFRAGWGPCPEYRIVLEKTLRLTINSEKKENPRQNDHRWHLGWKWMNRWVLLQIKRTRNPEMWLEECTLTSPPLSHMSLTCRGRPGELYPLLHEAQPSNSCWQSCLSPNHPITWRTNTWMWNIRKAAAFHTFQELKKTPSELILQTKNASKVVWVWQWVQLVDCEWRLLTKILNKIILSRFTLDPILSWTWSLIKSQMANIPVRTQRGSKTKRFVPPM